MRFIVVHPLPPGITRQQLEEMSRQTQADPKIKGYRSFLNLSEGRGVCLFDAPDKESLATWLRKNNMPYESITLVEVEGERGKMIDLATPVGAEGGARNA